MSEELVLLTNGTEKESPKPNHYVDDPSFIREEESQSGSAVSDLMCGR